MSPAMDSSRPSDWLEPELVRVVEACWDWSNKVGVPRLSKTELRDAVVALAELAGLQDPLGRAS